MTFDITEANFEQEVLQSKVPVLVDFWAPWCGPCRMVGPVFEELSVAYTDKAKFGKVNVDEQARLAEQFRVMSIPTIFLFKDGEVVNRLVGARPYDELASALDAVL